MSREARKAKKGEAAYEAEKVTGQLELSRLAKVV